MNNRRHDAERRRLLQTLAVGFGLAPWCHQSLAESSERLSPARIVVVGGGFGGSTCARYLKALAPDLNVTLVEPEMAYHTCPMSNLILIGERDMRSLQVSLAGLTSRFNVKVVRSTVMAIDYERRKVLLQNHLRLPYDRLVVAPGIDFKWQTPEGYDEHASLSMPHAWKAGSQTERLQHQIKHMRNGGVLAIAIPQSPFRCPPGPYERASLIAHYLKLHKPRSKILLLDANEKFSKQALFEQAWNKLYPGMIEWIPFSRDGAVRRVGVKSMTLFTELERHRVAVANVIPAQQAGRLAVQSGLTDGSGWCPVHPDSFASKQREHTYVLGDASLAEPMPKSATSANSQAKTCALAIVAELIGRSPPPATLHNTCYSLARPDYGISINAQYRVESDSVTLISGAGGMSPLDADTAFREREARYTRAWYESIRSDSFAET